MTENSIPTVQIGLRDDGTLCVLLPGFAKARAPIIAEDKLAEIVRGILVAQRDESQRAIGQNAEPTQQQLDHASHSAPRKGCAFCQSEAIVAAFEKTHEIKRIAPAQSKRISRRADGIEIRQMTPTHYCECGASGSLSEIAEHLSKNNPWFPRNPPEGTQCGHFDISGSKARGRERSAAWKDEPEWQDLYSQDGKGEIEL